VPRLGPTVLPQLLRALESDSESESQWASQLLRRADVTEVTTRLHKLLVTASRCDAVKARALAILADLGVSPPQEVSLRDPEQFIAQSVDELLQTIQSADDLRRTTDDLLTTVPTDELLPVLREVVRHGGEMGTALLEAVLLDARTPDTVAAELIPLTRPSREVTPRQTTKPVALPSLSAHSARPLRKALPMVRHPSRRMLLDALPVRRQSAPLRPRPVVDMKLTAASAALSSAHYDEAVKLLEQIVAEKPEHKPSWLHLAVAYSALAQHRQAARCFRRAMGLRTASRRRS
jgi:tetratricopeptide (TPR) repeat protein